MCMTRWGRWWRLEKGRRFKVSCFGRGEGQRGRIRKLCIGITFYPEWAAIPPNVPTDVNSCSLWRYSLLVECGTQERATVTLGLSPNRSSQFGRYFEATIVIVSSSSKNTQYLWHSEEEQTGFVRNSRRNWEAVSRVTDFFFDLVFDTCERLVALENMVMVRQWILSRHW
jgi:hypothetical protein